MIKRIYGFLAILIFFTSLGFIGNSDALIVMADNIQNETDGTEASYEVQDDGTEGEEEELPDEQIILEELTEDLTAFKVPFVKISSDINEYVNDKKQLSLKSGGLLPYKIKMKKQGILNFRLQMASPLKKGEKITLKIYKDKNFSYPVLHKKIENGENIIEFESFLEKGTYDFIFDLSGREKAYANMTFIAYNTSDFKADMQKENYIGYGNNNKIYIKLKLKKAGILKFSTAMQVKDAEGSSSLGIRYEICDSNKAPLSSGTTELEKAYNLSYGIKGGTYYVAITPTYGLYKFSYEIEEYPGSKNTKKESAYKLKRNRMRYHVFPVGYKKNIQYWFKFTLKKPQKLNLKMQFQGEDGNIHASLYHENEMIMIGGDSMLIEFPANELRSFEWRNEDGEFAEWPSGTYYLRIGKDKDTLNGVIRLLIA